MSTLIPYDEQVLGYRITFEVACNDGNGNNIHEAPMLVIGAWGNLNLESIGYNDEQDRHVGPSFTFTKVDRRCYMSIEGLPALRIYHEAEHAGNIIWNQYTTRWGDMLTFLNHQRTRELYNCTHADMRFYARWDRHYHLPFNDFEPTDYLIFLKEV